MKTALLASVLALSTPAFAAPELLKVMRESRGMKIDSASLQMLPAPGNAESDRAKNKGGAPITRSEPDGALIPHLIAVATFANPCLVPQEKDLVRQVKTVETADGKTKIAVDVFVAEQTRVCTMEYKPVQVKIDVWQVSNKLEANDPITLNGVQVEDETGN